jgi:hypothetical protein
MDYMRYVNRTLVTVCVTCLICATVGLLSCSKKEEAFIPAPFVANAALAGAPVQLTEIGLEFAPPAGWKTADSTQLDDFRRMLAGMELAREFFPIFPLVVAFDSATGGVMYIAQIEEESETMADIARRFDDFLSPRLKGSAINRQYYAINNLKIYYYMLHSAEMVNYKILGETSPGKRFLIEFIIAGPIFTAVEPSVSASLATLRAAP